MTASAANINEFATQGYTTARGLFSPAEVEALRMRFFWINENHRRVSDNITDESDPLANYPRVGQRRRWDEASLNWLIDPRLNAWLTAILGREPYAAQTMFYFKPPGARGQALHQDQFYLRVKPGTCVAAWMAVDRCDEENGCLFVVPGTHDIPVLCTVDADTDASFVNDTVELPPGYEPIPILMDPGDALFFNGQIVHGSYPNESPDRFRRAMIGHYIAGEAEAVDRHYHPVLRMDGSEVDFGLSEKGGPLRHLGRPRWRDGRRARRRRDAPGTSLAAAGLSARLVVANSLQTCISLLFSHWIQSLELGILACWMKRK